MQAGSDRDLQQQVEGLTLWCRSLMGSYTHKTLGNAEGMVSRYPAQHWMELQPDGTMFATYVNRGVFGSGGPLAHWIFAKKAGDEVEFVDYQTDKSEVAGSAPTRSDQPLMPGGKEIEGDCGMIVVAFVPTEALKGGTTDSSSTEAASSSPAAAAAAAAQ
jgi:hypothetical protein